MQHSNFFTQSLLFSLLILSSFFFTGCNNDDDGVPPINFTGQSKTYNLGSVSNPAISGTVEFKEIEGGSTQITIQLSGTSAGGSHPSHIHFNSAAEGGGIAVSLTPVDGATGTSVTEVSSLDDDTAISYQQLLDFNGYINVHLSSNDLATIVAQGDIGNNELTGMSKSYTLGERNSSGVSGTVIFSERKDGTTLATLDLNGTPANGMHPAHIHANSAAEGGGILVTFNMVNGATGMSQTSIRSFDEGVNDGAALTYADLMTIDAYVNVHLSAQDLTVVSQGDIGGNELTGTSKSYTLATLNNSGVGGTLTFAERMNGNTLATFELTGTPANGMHPAHIHANSAAEGGGILVTFNMVNGATGMSQTTIRNFNDGVNGGAALTYSDLMMIDAYVNVHLSAQDLTVVAQSDIGGNELTGENIVYTLATLNDSGVGGTLTFAERMNGNTLATFALTGTPADGMHPAHIHANSAAEGGGILVTFSMINGATGMSQTTIRNFDNGVNGGAALTYEDLDTIDAYVNVHLSATDLTVVAQSDIGANR